MPITLKEPRGTSPHFRARGTYLGVYVDRSTKAADRATAKKIVKQIERDIERGRFQEPVKTGPTFADAAYRYVRDGHDQRFIHQLAGHFGETPLDQIDQKAIDDAAHKLLPAATNATRNRQVHTPMSAILRHAGVDMRLRRPKGANGQRREFFFRPEQAEDVINAAYDQSAEFGLFLTFLLYTGCRLSEACGLLVEDVELSRATALVRDTKNGTDRRVHLPPVLVAAMAAHPRGLERGGMVFAFTKGSRLYKRLERAAEAAGVTIPDGVAFHAFRHSFGAYARRYGGLDTSGLVATGAWLSPDAARRYEHADVSEAARASDLFPVIKIRA